MCDGEDGVGWWKNGRQKIDKRERNIDKEKGENKNREG